MDKRIEEKNRWIKRIKEKYISTKKMDKRMKNKNR